MENEDVDPQWKLFLENLREDGNSYALEAVRENGVSELIRYHREDGLPRQIKRGCISNKDVDPQWKLFLENWREDGNSYALEVVGGNGVSELIRYHREDGFARRVKRRCISIEDVDPQYKLFKESLREDGNSYALEMVQEDGSLKQIRYHQDDGLPDELNLETMPQLKEKTKIKNRVTLENLEDAPKKKSSVVKRNLKLDAPEPVSDGTDVRSSKRPCLEVPSTPESLRSSSLKEKTETRRTSRMVMKEDHPKKNSSKVKKHVNVEDADPLSGRTNGCSNKQPGSKNLRLSEGGSNSEAESDSNLTDDNYQEFLSCTKDDGKIVVFKPKNCEPILYDADVESSSDSDVIVLDRDPHERYRTPIIDVDSGRGTESHSQFRQGIMKDLKRPYDLEEYLNLLEDWSRQIPTTSHDRNLRNGKIKSYSLPGEFGRSYLEMYKDLAGKIDAATGDDRPRKLNLLRGFFYWLKNVTQEGSFKPWNDKACLRVLPEKR